MSRPRIRPLGVRGLVDLPSTCPPCVLGGGQHPGLESDGTPATWTRAAETDWGFCGFALFHVEQAVGYVLLSSPLHVPRLGPQSGYGLNPDAAVIMSLRVLPAYIGQGFGRQLVQAAASRITHTPFRALEVCSTPGPGQCAVPPMGFLTAVGFQLIDPHPVHPRLRLDLARTIRWTPDLRPVLDRLLGWARPLPPEPANRAHRQAPRSLGSRP